MKGSNQLTGIGQFVFAFGLLAWLPSLANQELLILSWLGSWQVPIGLSAVVVGAVVWGIGKLQVLRDRPATGTSAADSGVGTADVPAIAPNTIATPAQPNVLAASAAPDRPVSD
jgi:hypothetical protein